MSRITLIPLKPAIAARLDIELGDAPTIAYAAIEPAPQSRGRRSIKHDGQRVRVVGCGGLSWYEGLCWLWLDSVLMERTSAVAVVRTANAMLRKAVQLGEERVFAARDEAPRSTKLLTLLGFVRQPDHPALMGKELWIWHRSPPSQL